MIAHISGIPVEELVLLFAGGVETMWAVVRALGVATRALAARRGHDWRTRPIGDHE